MGNTSSHLTIKLKQTQWEMEIVLGAEETVANGENNNKNQKKHFWQFPYEGDFTQLQQFENVDLEWSHFCFSLLNDIWSLENLKSMQNIFKIYSERARKRGNIQEYLGDRYAVQISRGACKELTGWSATHSFSVYPYRRLELGLEVTHTNMGWPCLKGHLRYHDKHLTWNVFIYLFTFCCVGIQFDFH